MYTIVTSISSESSLVKTVVTQGESNLSEIWNAHVTGVEAPADIKSGVDATGWKIKEKHPLAEVFDLCMADTLFGVYRHDSDIDNRFTGCMEEMSAIRCQAKRLENYGVTTTTTPLVRSLIVSSTAEVTKRMRNIIVGYDSPNAVISAAIVQATKGKGQRHGGGETPFLEQPWVRLYKTHGLGFLLGQADKKYHEACGKEDKEDAEREFLGAIVYLGMALLVLEGKVK